MVDCPLKPTKMAARGGTPPHENVNNFFQSIHFEILYWTKCCSEVLAIHQGTKSSKQNVKHIIWKEVIKFSMPHMYHPEKVHVLSGGIHYSFYWRKKDSGSLAAILVLKSVFFFFFFFFAWSSRTPTEPLYHAQFRVFTQLAAHTWYKWLRLLGELVRGFLHVLCLCSQA